MSSIAELESLIARHPLTHGLAPPHLRILAESALEVAFARGEQIFRTGDEANRFYLILDGAVQIESRDEFGQKNPIQIIRSGDVLGWSWLFPPYRWNFDARASETTRAIFFYGTRLRAQCDDDHDFGYEMLRRMSQVLLDRLQSTRRELARTRRLSPVAAPAAT